MNIVSRITVNMKPVSQVMKKLGVDKRGDVQRNFTQMAANRIEKYLPYRTGMFAKAMFMNITPTTITHPGPYARFLYYGKLMVDPVTGAAGYFNKKKDQWQSRTKAPHVPKVESNRPITYSTHKNAQAGPFWDKRMMASEGDALQQEIQNYVNERSGKK